MSKLFVRKGKYENKDAITKLIKYVSTTRQDSEVLLTEGFGVNCLSNQTMIDSMINSKVRVNKLEGKQAYHLIISIYRTNNVMSTNQKLIYGKDLVYFVGNFFFNKDIQSVITLQQEKEGYWDNIHIHCVINNLNLSTGKRLTNTRILFQQLKNQIKCEYPYLEMEDYVTFK